MNSSATAVASNCKNFPVGVDANGRPAESSMVISQRCNSAMTSSASCRSGVIRAAVFSGVSKTSRKHNAIRPASSPRSRAVRILRLASAARPGKSALSPNRCHAAVTVAGRNISRINCWRACCVGEAAGRPGQSCTSSGLTSSVSSNFASACCG